MDNFDYSQEMYEDVANYYDDSIAEESALIIGPRPPFWWNPRPPMWGPRPPFWGPMYPPFWGPRPPMWGPRPPQGPRPPRPRPY